MNTAGISIAQPSVAPRWETPGEALSLQGALSRMQETLGTLNVNGTQVTMNSRTSFGSGGTNVYAPGLGYFLGETHYYGQNSRGDLTPVRTPPRNAEEAQQFNVDRPTLFEANQELRRIRQQVEALRRLDNGPTDLNSQRGVVVESGRFFGRGYGKHGTPASRSLTYDNNGNVSYESRLGNPGSSRVQSYQGNAYQFRYVSGREGQVPTRVMETTQNGFVRDTKSR